MICATWGGSMEAVCKYGHPDANRPEANRPDALN